MPEPKSKLTVATADADLKMAYEAKAPLIRREKEDHLFALGEQWTEAEKHKLKQSGVEPVVDNRIQPNLHLLTGLERQNRSDFKAFPQGEEDGVKAEIASALFKDAIRKSGFGFKSSEQFKDGITCGESHLELYLTNEDSLINATPKWYKCDGRTVLWDPASREYDFADARFVYKVKYGVEREALANLYPKKRRAIMQAVGGKVDLDLEGGEQHTQKKDYPKAGEGNSSFNGGADDGGLDLVERYYKKWVQQAFIADKQTGQVNQSGSLEEAQAFVAEYLARIDRDLMLFEQARQQAEAEAAANPGVAIQEPPPPPEQDPERFLIIKRVVAEIWCFAYVPGMDEPLQHARAWFYPKWKGWPFAPYFARHSTAPLTGDDRHLLVQGLVHGVKGSQKKHNKAEMLLLRHLNSSANSGWLAQEDSWVDPDKVEQFGSVPGINLEYKKGSVNPPSRIEPAQLSTAHAQVSIDSAESIKAQLGINSDLIAANESSGDSGKAIALRQKQGLLMVQELFDNLSRTREIAGRMLLSQLGEVYDTETAKKVLGEAWLVKSFPPPMLMNPETLQPEPMPDPKTGQPMQYDTEMAELAIAEVLGGDLERYDVSVGEAVASETQKMAVGMEVQELAKALPGVIPPQVLVQYSQLPESAKKEIMAAYQQAQAAAQQQAQAGQQPRGE